jgi:hypothetical protein
MQMKIFISIVTNKKTNKEIQHQSFYQHFQALIILM